MANTPNIDLEKLGAGSKLKDFPDMFNTDMEKIDSSLGYGFGRSSNPTVKAYVDNVNTKSSVYTADSGVSLLQLAFNDNVCPANSVKWINIRNCSTGDLPTSSAVYGMARVDRRVSTVARVDIYTDGGAHYFCSSSDTGSTWSAWESVALNSQKVDKNKIVTTSTTDFKNFVVGVIQASGNTDDPVIIAIGNNSNNGWMIYHPGNRRFFAVWGTDVYHGIANSDRTGWSNLFKVTSTAVT